MKSALFSFAVTLFFAAQALAGDALPFAVTVGGESAKDGVPFAKVEKPVAANAELNVAAKADLIIVNVHQVNAKNEPAPNTQPAVILLQGTNKTTLDKTMDGKKLTPGKYLMSVVGGEKTASILLTIQ